MFYANFFVATSNFYTFYTGPNDSHCRLQVQKALRTEATKGGFVPRCQSNNDFEEVQCNEWTGYCWCVDRSGKEIRNTKTKDFIFCPGLGKIMLDNIVYHHHHYQYNVIIIFIIIRFSPTTWSIQTQKSTPPIFPYPDLTLGQ
jgi:hypothetical protein